jgi:small-conductance mechanosensitive channel
MITKPLVPSCVMLSVLLMLLAAATLPVFGQSPPATPAATPAAPADAGNDVPHTLGEAIRSVAPRLADVWTFQLASVQGRAIRVGSLVTALLVFLVGVPVARLVARILTGRVYPRIGLTPGAAAAFGTLSRYALLVVVLIFALWFSGIPLTIFTIAGGALAIGVGFGSQNILNNFISGLILLAERPIKVGDLVEVDGTHGEVELIGLRSTRIRTFDNIHIIVPNATFLESNVVNWTLSDQQVRVTLTVGVVYGSPTRRVEELIRLAMREHPQVLPDPEPQVFFADFGDSALIFEALFWIIVRRFQDRRRVLSDLRFRIDEMFREEEIVIAFPQRDVHLDSVRPIEVRMVERDDEEEGPGA